MSMRKSIEERFFAKVDKSGECWEWLGSKTPSGYGSIYSGGPKDQARLIPAHRFSYELHIGPIPEGLYVDHVCRVRSCVNPKHLRIASPKQNQENRNRKGWGHSGARGVYPNANGNKYTARVVHNGQYYRLGSYSTIEEAEAVVIAKRNELFTHNDADRCEIRRSGVNA